jgi:hypothetical protein
MVSGTGIGVKEEYATEVLESEAPVLLVFVADTNQICA